MFEQLISFKTAVLSKEKGFDWLTHSAFNEKEQQCAKIYQSIGANGETSWEKYWNKEDVFYSRPTQSHLQKWLREEQKIEIDIKVVKEGYKAYVFRNHSEALDKVIDFLKERKGIEKTYELALEGALQEALNLIKC